MNTNLSTLLALDEYVHGHSEAKKALITMLSRSKMRWYQKYIREMHEDYILSPMKILLIGASGTGKSYLLHSLQKIAHFPLIKIDATDLIPSGGSGGISSDALKKMILQEALKCCKQYPYLYPSHEGAIDKTVVYVDEIDKLGQSFESSGNWNKHVQSNFLTIFDNKDEYAGVSFVFAGAFNSITAEPKFHDRQIGFFNNQGKETKDLIDQRVLKSGLIPEIVGRMTAIIELDTFTKDELYTILIERILPKKNMDLAAYHMFDQPISEEVLRQIAEEADKSGQGVRYLNRALDKHFLDIEFEANVDSIIFGEVL